MGYEELIASLRAEGEEKVRSIRTETDSEAEKITAEKEGVINRMRDEFRKKEDHLTRVQEDKMLSSAEKKVRIIMLAAEKSLSTRLFELSLTCLHELRNNGYDGVLSALFRELPDAVWTEARVNPADTEAARKHFPGAEIIPDDGISGGIDVSTENRRRHIINTFEKRLERAWDELLPALVSDAREEASRNGIPANN